MLIKGVVDTIAAPDGAIWAVGDRVTLLPYATGAKAVNTEIFGIFPGNGRWERELPGGDADAVWFSLANGWMARPWLLRRQC